jgi:hypothetical protein
MRKLKIYLQGGLGNQLFILYAGKYWAERSNRTLLIDLRTLKSHKKTRDFALSNFGINKDFEVQDSAKLDAFPYIKRLVDYAVSNFKFIRKLSQNFCGYYLESDVRIDMNNSSVSKMRFLTGYFQSLSYLQNSRNDKPKLKNPTDWFCETKKAIYSERPIIIHYRAGDYFNHKDSFGVLDSKYYLESIESLKAELRLRDIWVFSDDIERAQAQLTGLSGRQITWVSPPTNSPDVESLLLMSYGAALIMSNSTFSWWAAYWADSPAEIICPEQWTKNNEFNPDFILPSWTKIRSDWI